MGNALIEPLRSSEAGADVLELWNRWEAELPPGGRPVELEELRLRFLHPGGARQRHDWFVDRDGDGRAQGIAHLERWFQAENRQLAECEILVDPGSRRQGIGRRLLAGLCEMATADGRASLIAWGPLTRPSRAFWESAGLELRYEERIGRCDLERTDAELMRRWIAGAPSADAFELVRWKGLCPPDLLERYAEAETAANDAPLDQLEMDDISFDAASMHERDRLLIESGLEPWVVLALVQDTGAVAGVTEVFVNAHDPTYSEQWTTVVVAEHRGRRLARLLKASMFEWLRAERPDVRFLDTGNASSNAAVLAINDAMGYERYRTYACWQAPISAIAA